MKQELQIAVGIIQDPKRGILIAKRPKHTHLGGYWEFPGGKCEHGEDIQTALCRELQEELGITVKECMPFTQIEHEYPEKFVVLHVWQVKSFSGVPEGREGQEILWVKLKYLRNYQFPKPNQQILTLLGA